MGLLSGGARALFGELFSPLYLSASVYSVGDTYDGQGTLRRRRQERTCRAQVDRCTERMVQAEGYTDTDRGVLILAATLEGEVETGHEFIVHEGEYAGTLWRLASPIDRDPATAYWSARAVRVKAAANG